MGPYHALMSHFPVGLWMTATLMILFRAFSDGVLARNLERVLVPLLMWAAITGAIAYALGFLVWPYEALVRSPLGRNHLLMATWAQVHWMMVLFIAWRAGSAVWGGAGRWVMAGLAALGAGLLGIAGALGGHLIGNPTMVSGLLGTAGWEVYTTFYVPTGILIAMGLSILLLVVLAMINPGANQVKTK
jgi:hypothetical protein